MPQQQTSILLKQQSLTMSQQQNQTSSQQQTPTTLQQQPLTTPQHCCQQQTPTTPQSQDVLVTTAYHTIQVRIIKSFQMFVTQGLQKNLPPLPFCF